MNRALTILCLVATPAAVAGDSRYFSLGPIGVGEIGNRILLYLGDDVVRTPIPATKEFFIVGVALAAGLAAVAVWRIWASPKGSE